MLNFTILCLTCTQIFGTLQEQEIEPAFDYIKTTVENVEIPVILPMVYRVEFPKISYQGMALRNNNHDVDWWTEFVPPQGVILVRKEWELASVQDRAILIHEACHILDMKTLKGCNCDPYTIQYYFMLEHDYSIEQIRILYNMEKHDWSRKCDLKIKNELKNNSKPHRLQKM